MWHVFLSIAKLKFGLPFLFCCFRSSSSSSFFGRPRRHLEIKLSVGRFGSASATWRTHVSFCCLTLCWQYLYLSHTHYLPSFCCVWHSIWQEENVVSLIFCNNTKFSQRAQSTSLELLPCNFAKCTNEKRFPSSQCFPARPISRCFSVLSSRVHIVQIYRHLHGAWHWNCKLATHREHC